MKKVISYVIIATLILNCVCTTRYAVDYKYDRTRPVPVSMRVGDAVDFDERAQFGLFPNITYFKSAVFYRIYDAGYRSGYVVEIETEDNKLLAVNYDPEARAILQDYINRYEEICDNREAFEDKWGIVAYDSLGQPITKGELERVEGQSVSVCVCLGGALGGILGFLPIFFIAWYVGGSSLNVWSGESKITPLTWAILVGGTALNIYTGARLASKDDDNSDKALKKVLESRKPKIVDHF